MPAMFFQAAVKIFANLRMKIGCIRFSFDPITFTVKMGFHPHTGAENPIFTAVN